VLRNTETQLYKLAKGITAKFRWVVTGTPLQNDLNDLQTLFNIVNHKKFRFSSGKDYTKMTKLDLLKHVAMLRRTKESIIDGAPIISLPDIEYNDVLIKLSQEERMIYEIVSENCTFLKTGLNVAHYTKGWPTKQDITEADFKKLNEMKAKQEEKCKCGSKLKYLLGNLKELKGKTIVFSTFKFVLQSVKEELQKSHTSVSSITGDDSEDRRSEAILKFKLDPKISLLLMTIATGNCGLDLSAAQNVIILERQWNPSTEQQAIARMHRIGIF
jgi:SNF2 family DNA or RNA helicase